MPHLWESLAAPSFTVSRAFKREPTTRAPPLFTTKPQPSALSDTCLRGVSRSPQGPHYVSNKAFHISSWVSGCGGVTMQTSFAGEWGAVRYFLFLHSALVSWIPRLCPPTPESALALICSLLLLPACGYHNCLGVCSCNVPFCSLQDGLICYWYLHFLHEC